MEDRKKDHLYAQVKDSIEKEMEERQHDKASKNQEEETQETNSMMGMISKQQQQLAELVKQARMGT